MQFKIEMDPTPPHGWLCPLCSRVHAPWVATCECVMPAVAPRPPEPCEPPQDWTVGDQTKSVTQPKRDESEWTPVWAEINDDVIRSVLDRARR